MPKQPRTDSTKLTVHICERPDYAALLTMYHATGSIGTFLTVEATQGLIDSLTELLEDYNNA